MTTTPESPSPDEPDTGSQGEQTAADAADRVLDAAAAVVDAAAGDVLAAEPERDPEAVMDPLDSPRRLLLLHAHPDDESLTTGAAMAAAVAAGVRVTLVTCTRGERGEVVGDEHPGLASDPDALGEHRVGELAAAMEALRVTDHRFLGDAAGVRYRDSGMAWSGAPGASAVVAADRGPDAFASADVDEAAGHLAQVLREVRPQVLVSYDPGGGYGHPDHVQAARVAARAVELAAHPDGPQEAWQVSRLYQVVLPEEQHRAALRELADQGLPVADPDGPMPSAVVPDDQVDTAVDAREQLPAKAAALRAHATQVQVGAQSYALSNGLHHPLVGVEHFRLAGDSSHLPAGASSDLFDGLP